MRLISTHIVLSLLVINFGSLIIIYFLLFSHSIVVELFSRLLVVDVLLLEFCMHSELHVNNYSIDDCIFDF